MPGFIKSPEDEKAWEKAKSLAKEQDKAENWPYITGIWKRIRGKEAMASRIAFQHIRTSQNKVAGLSRHWKILKPLTDAEWQKVLQLAHGVILKAELGEIPIRGPGGRGRPALQPAMIALNGDRSLGQAGEAFTLMPIGAGSWESCKTYGLLYDRVVWHILTGMKALVPGKIQLSSDVGLPIGPV